MKENKEKSKKNSKIMTIIAIIILLILLCIICLGYYKKQTVNISNPVVTMEVEKFGTIKIELYPDKAPNTVANFITLANNGFYDGLTFHRIVKDFMIQGGDSEGTGQGSAVLGSLYNNDDNTEYSIPGEFVANGYNDNDLNLTEGVIAMARADYTSYSPSLSEESYNSAGTQFFIMTSNDNTSLSGFYAGFGKVVEGIDIVKSISEVEVTDVTVDEEGNESKTGEASIPVEDVVITSVKVETFGIDYGFPQTLKPFDYMSWLYSLYGISN